MISFKTGTLADGTPLAVNVANSVWPITVTLSSAAAGRKIELSTDGGVNYFTPTYDATETNMINVSVTAPISHARLTGAAADVWSVR